MLASVLPFILVGVGGAGGALARYLLSLGLQHYSLTLPLGTLTANLGGCFIIGGIAQLAATGDLLSPSARLLLATGFCGGFTTLSSLIFELAQLLKDGEIVNSMIYFCATFAGAFVSFYAGVLAVKALGHS